MVDPCIVSFDTTNCVFPLAVASGKWFSAVLVFWDTLHGASSYAVSTRCTDGQSWTFPRLRFLAGNAS